MSRQRDIQKLIEEHNRRLQKLKEQQARYGNFADPSIVIEIEDVEKKIEILQSELASLNPYSPNLSSVIGQTQPIQQPKPSFLSRLGKLGNLILALAAIIPCVISLCAFLGFGNAMDLFRVSPPPKITPSVQPVPIPTDTPAPPILPSPTHTLPPLPTNTAIPIAPPTTIPEQATAPGGFFRSCQEILENGQSQDDDYYTIDADGSEGRLDPFEVYCDMTRQGGGWTLFAYHTDGIRVREVPEVTISETGVIQADRWRALRNNMTTGMMFIDELGKVSAISAKNLNDGSCQNIQNPSSLLPPSGASKQLWHDEMRGCNGTGQDYSVIMLQGPAYENYGFSGAALYQYSELKFDPWPYNNKSVSYSEQNELFYYIK